MKRLISRVGLSGWPVRNEFYGGCAGDGFGLFFAAPVDNGKGTADFGIQNDVDPGGVAHVRGVGEPVGEGAHDALALVRHVLYDEHTEYFRPTDIRQFHEALEEPVFGLGEDLPVKFQSCGSALEKGMHPDRLHGEIAYPSHRTEKDIRLIHAVLHLQGGQRAEEIFQRELGRLVVGHHEDPAPSVVFGKILDGERICRGIGVIDDGSSEEIVHFRAKTFRIHDIRQFSFHGRSLHEISENLVCLVLPADADVVRFADLLVLRASGEIRRLHIGAHLFGDIEDCGSGGCDEQKQAYHCRDDAARDLALFRGSYGSRLWLRLVCSRLCRIPSWRYAGLAGVGLS